jgi:hypothetical protein
MFNDIVMWTRKSRRTKTNPNEKYYVISGFRQDTAALVASWKDTTDELTEPVVEEG